MKQKIFAIVKYLAFLILGIGLFWWAMRGQNLNELKHALSQVNYMWIGLSMVFAIASHLSRAMRWNLLIEPLGYDVKTKNTFLAVMIGYLANFAVPRMGEIVRCGIINKYEKVPLNKLIGTIIIERGVELILLIFLLLLTFVLQIDVVTKMYDSLQSSAPAAEKGSSFPWTIVIIIASIVVLFIVLKLIKKTAFYGRIKIVFSGFWTGIKSVKHMKNKRGFIGHTIFIWVMYYLMAYICVFSMEATSHLNPLAGLSILTMGSLGIIAPVPGGIGAYHQIVSKTLVLYNVDLSAGLVFATVVHGAQTVLIIVVGAVSLILLPLVNRKKATDEPVINN